MQQLLLRTGLIWRCESCFVLLLSVLLLHFVLTELAASDEKNNVLFFPLSQSSTADHFVLRRKDSIRFRLLSETTGSANAGMYLYDDLLNKGYYTTRLWIGSPPQEFALIVDTGSTITYVPCSSCTHCGKHQDPGFKPEASNTYTKVKCSSECFSCDSKRQQCKYQRRYAEMSTSEGLLANDIISFGNKSTLAQQRVVFGCETTETGDIYNQLADGIMGLGRGKYSIVDQLIQHKAMAASFSLCYGGMGISGGAMIMGAIPYPPKMVYTASDISRSAYYNLGLEKIYVGGSLLPVDISTFDLSFGTVLDSGTTYAYFPDKAFLAFKIALKNHVKLHQVAGPDPEYPDICFEGAGSDYSKLVKMFPTVQLKFRDGQVVPLAPENYLFRHLKTPGAYCLGIFASGKDSATLLGGIIVRNMLVTYDRANNRIGFARTNCSNLLADLQLNKHIPVSKDRPLRPSAPSVTPPPIVSSSSHKSPKGIPSNATLAGVSGQLDISLQLNMTYTEFLKWKPNIFERISHELHMNMSQIKLLNVTNTAGKLKLVLRIDEITADARLMSTSAQTILDKITRNGSAQNDVLESSRLMQPDILKESENHAFSTVTVVAFVFLFLTVVGSVVWYKYHTSNQKYMILQQAVEMTDQLK